MREIVSDAVVDPGHGGVDRLRLAAGFQGDVDEGHERPEGDVGGAEAGFGDCGVGAR